MAKEGNKFIEELNCRKLLTDSQLESIKEYDALGIFSLHNELRVLLYLGVLLFTSGVGIIVYQNVDSVSHIALLSVLFLMIVFGFYFCLKKAKGFHKSEVVFDNQVYDYIVLLCIILSSIFLGYLQFQHQVFGFGLSSLICSFIGLSCAYYFDNKSALAIGITGLATFIGISVVPKTVFNNEIYNNPSLTYYGLGLGILLILWLEYSNKISLKKHFQIVLLTFGQHLIGTCIIAGLFQEYWYVFAVLLVTVVYYFYKLSYTINSIFVFVFTLLYAYIGINVLLLKIFELIDFSFFAEFFILSMPLYFIGSIISFVKLMQHFNNKKS